MATKAWVTTSVDLLKTSFSAGHVPTAQNFSDLIDLAAIARAVLGLEPGGKGPGAGLAIDTNTMLLQVNADTTGPLKFDAQNKALYLNVAPELVKAGGNGALGLNVTNGITIDSGNNLTLVAKANGGISVTDGLSVVANKEQGLDVSAAGLALKLKPGGGLVASTDTDTKGMLTVDPKILDTDLVAAFKKLNSTELAEIGTCLAKSKTGLDLDSQLQVAKAKSTFKKYVADGVTELLTKGGDAFKYKDEDLEQTFYETIAAWEAQRVWDAAAKVMYSMKQLEQASDAAPSHSDKSALGEMIWKLYDKWWQDGKRAGTAQGWTHDQVNAAVAEVSGPNPHNKNLSDLAKLILPAWDDGQGHAKSVYLGHSDKEYQAAWTQRNNYQDFGVLATNTLNLLVANGYGHEIDKGRAFQLGYKMFEIVHGWGRSVYNADDLAQNPTLSIELLLPWGR